jgi:NAD(P)-dependent dehydrogenase (short-subunit alcohol dehydrogenase family)
MHIKNKVAVITGGASGLGQATARHFVNLGAKVAIFDMNEEAGKATAAELGEGNAIFCQTDVTSEESVQAAVDAIVDKFGTIHININAAGVPAPCNVLDREGNATPLKKFAFVTAVNLNGIFNVMSKCAAAMVKNPPENGEERGVVINISSGAAYEGQIGQNAYASSKAGVIGLNLPAARELGRFGVRVNSIAPGLFQTPMVAGLGEEVIESLVDMIEAPKRCGDMQEFAHCCQFIVENAYINGETIRLDAATRLRAK